MMSVEGASFESGFGEMEIYKLVESRALHSCEDAEGRVLVCLNSLRRWMSSNNQPERKENKCKSALKN